MGSTFHFLDPTDGVFVNVDGQTGEMVRDPNTGELKVVIGSNQPVAGGAGGTTQAAPSQIGTNPGLAFNKALSQQFLGVPVWLLGFFLLLIVFGTGVRHMRK